jgi:hypothetical protein
MTKLSRRSLLTGLAAVLATSLIGGTAAWAVYSWTHHTKVTVRSADAVEPTVKVLGEVTGLLPGESRPLRVVIENSNEFPMQVTKISGGSVATASGCPEWAVRIAPSTDSETAVTIPRRASRTIIVQVRMEDWADQKCAGQSFSLDLTTLLAAA